MGLINVIGIDVIGALSWSTVTWDVARTSGIVAYVLLSLSVALGLALSLRWQTRRWPRLITNEMHGFLTVLSLVFIAVHGLAVWIDPFMKFGWTEIVVPMMSHYRPLWVAFGIVAAYLCVAIWISTQLRPHIGYTWWRRLHTLTFAVYVLATIHGIGTGSDTQTPWALGLYAGSGLLVGGLLVYRLLTPLGARRRAYPNLAGLVAMVMVGCALWTATGPARAGWNAIANNGQGSGARGQIAAQTTTTTRALHISSPFTASLQGTMTQGSPAADGTVTVRIATTLTDGTRRTLNVVMQGQPDDTGNLSVTATHVTLAPAGGTPAYQGTVTNLESVGALRLSALLNGTASGSNGLQLLIELRTAQNGQVSGVVQATPVTRDASGQDGTDSQTETGSST